MTFFKQKMAYYLCKQKKERGGEMCAIFDKPNDKPQQANNELKGEAVQPNSSWRKKRKDETITDPSCFSELVGGVLIGNKRKKCTEWHKRAYKDELHYLTEKNF